MICWRIKWRNGPYNDVTCDDARTDPPTCVQDGNCEVVPEPATPAKTCSGKPCTPRTDWWAYLGCLMYNGPKPSTFYEAPAVVTAGGIHSRCYVAAQVCWEGGVPCNPCANGPGTPEMPVNQKAIGPASARWYR
jgi:hypothetical protein